MGVLVLGTVALDTVKTPKGIRRDIIGGSAAHFSMSARFFTKVSIVACVGEDFPQKNINLLKSKGLDLDSLSVQKGKTFHWQGEYKGDLNTAITLKTELGVLSSFKPNILKKQREIKYVFLANVDPDIQQSLLKNMHSPEIVALDSMNYWIDTKRKSLIRLLKDVDIYLANDKEAISLSQESNLIKAAKSLCRMGPSMVLIKKGEHGSLFYDGKYFFALPAYPAEEVIDPTGAGDTFAGGFMGYLAKCGKVNALTIKNALAYGTVAASFNIEGFGLEAPARLKISDLNNRFSKFKKYASF
ncbi:MAG: bifunctional hydroxymethylpyrimidine kinase/phosphomethylpyrimidine kinase [Candidatus Omnitrophica bacterium]|nr:bifunctional hydroxymethylpyrimidine kinase/phosphomethylpyrimidine kinase [Candidatus Omnitrophota bacterium]